MDKKGKVEPTILSGFMELLPAEQILFNTMLDKIRETYELFGFMPLDTPVIEKAEILFAKDNGETSKQIYRFQKGDNDLALRFDLTVPLARYVAQYYTKLQFPFRRYHIGKVYRGERPQKGRFREFYQCDIDIIGDGQLGLINDAEIPSVIFAVFCQLGFKSFTIRINNRKILTGFFRSQCISGEQQVEILRIVDKLDKIGEEAVKKEFISLGLNKEAIEKVFMLIGIKGDNSQIVEQLKSLGVNNEIFFSGVSELETVISAIRRFGVPAENLKIDLTIARGLDYYTGTVYETVLNDHPEIGSVCSGGRYDNLAESYTDRKLPGVGISIGLTRLFSKLLEAEIIKPASSTPAKVLVIPMDGYFDRAMEVAACFRQNEISTTIYLEETKPSKIFKYADKIGIPFVAIMGGNEAETGLVSLKNMRTNQQRQVSVADAMNIVNNKGE